MDCLLSPRQLQSLSPLSATSQDQINRYLRSLHTRNYAPHTLASYALDLRLFFTAIDKSVAEVTWRDIDRFIEQQHNQGLAATSINRRLNAIKRFFDFLVIEQECLPSNPVKPSHRLRQGR